MDNVLLVIRLILAGVFIVAGVGKLADLRGSVQAMRDFGIPEKLAKPFGYALPIVEIVVAFALFPNVTVRLGAAGAMLLLLAFIVGISINMARGSAPDCHCFGQIHSEPAGWRTLIRNSALAAMAALLLFVGWSNPGTSPVDWVVELTIFERIVLGGGGVVLALLAVQGWVLFQIVRQNGRLSLRLDALEGGTEVIEPAQSSGHQHSSRGLPPGSPAPAFSLPNLNGDVTTLSDVLMPNNPTMLLFTDPGCGPCNALLPDIGKWQALYSDRISLVLISRGDVEANQAKANEYEIGNILLQENFEVATAYESNGTPSAVLVRPDGTIGSHTVGGVDAIRQMVTAIASAPAANGSESLRNSSRLVGRSIPNMALPTLDGEEVALASLLDKQTALLFWDPGCIYCQRMLDDLNAFLAESPPESPGVVVISSGDPEAVRAQHIAARILLDPEFVLAREVGATGTPGAILVDAEGRVASSLAVGAPAIYKMVGIRQGQEFSD